MSAAFARCFSSPRQYQLWVEAARHSKPDRSSYCSDCTPEYQAAMKKEYRCGFLGTTFHTDADGFIEGRRPIEDRRIASEGA